jgi:adenylate cyclase
MLSIFFSDLEGFTGISEGLYPETLTALLNDYLSAMTDIIQEEGGTVDKYEGDAIIAFWNAPLEQPDHARRCVRAALLCQARLAQMRPQFRDRLGKDLNMRIGKTVGRLSSETWAHIPGLTIP